MNNQKNNINDLLNDVKSILEQEGVFFWLDFGSLLAAIRDKKYFTWDKDLDFGIFYDDIDKVLGSLKIFEDKGYHIRIEKDLPFVDGIIQIYPPKEIFNNISSLDHIDLLVYKKHQDGFWMRQLYWPRGRYATIYKYIWRMIYIFSGKFEHKNKVVKIIRKLPLLVRHYLSKRMIMFLINMSSCRYNYIPSNNFKSFINIKFYNLNFNIPECYENHLEYLYGSDWKIPIQDWQWRRDARTEKFLPASMLGNPHFIYNR